MTTLTIKNIPDELYQSLKQQALQHHRSLNSEIIVSLEQVVHQYRPNQQLLLKEASRLRGKTAKFHIREKKLKSTKEEGRS